MDFSKWFDTHYRRPSEAKTRAIHRMSMETGLGWTTILRAVEGSRLQSGSAIVLSKATGGAVAVESLTTAPTRASIAKSTDDAA